MNYKTIGPLVELCNFKSNMHESSCQSKKQAMAIMNWSSGESHVPLVFFFFFFFFFLFSCFLCFFLQ